MEQDYNYLNGHFILININNGKIELITDATSLTPVYYSENEKIIIPYSKENYSRYNPYVKLNIDTFEQSRIKLPYKSLKNKRIERLILDNVRYSNEYFKDKELDVIFKANNFGKALLSILNLSLVKKNIVISKSESLNSSNIVQVARSYHMNIKEENESVSKEREGVQNTANNLLMNYKTFLVNNDNEGLYKQFKISSDEEVKESQLLVEYNTLSRNYYNHIDDETLIFDPFNVRVIQSIIYYHNIQEEINIFQRIISILQPTIDFYDFDSGENIKQQYKKLSLKYSKLKSEMDKIHPNYPFLNEAYMKGYQVSDNLDGEIRNNSIKVFPATHEIVKGDIYSIEFYKETNGLILIESFFDNERNAHRIKVEVNGEIMNIDEFFNGKFISINNDVKIRMWYERNYNALSWQKAGVLVIKEID